MKFPSPAVYFQLPSDGTASDTDKVPVAPTHRRGRIAYTKICLLSRVWFSRSTVACKITSTGWERIMNLYNAEAGKLEGLSHHPSIPFCDFELSLVSVKIFAGCIRWSKCWHHCSICIAVTVGAAVYEWDWAHVVFTDRLRPQCWGLVYELAHGFPHHFKLKKAHCYVHLCL